jgi:V8-like Glu-specific endopeptidase
VLAVAAPAAAAPDGPVSIIGGTTTTDGEYPSVVAIKIGDNLCTGTLVASSWVLTAGHCVDPVVLHFASQDELTAAVRVQFHTLEADDPDATIVTAIATIKDPLFNKDHLGSNDIGLIKLATPVTDIEPSLINFAASKVPVGTVVTVVGYGSTERAGRGITGVQFELKNRTSVSCPSLQIGLDSNLLCFSQADDKGTCLGDSGGPAFATVDGQRTVVGVTSFGDEQCAEFGAETRVDIEETFLTTQAPDLAGCSRDADCPLRRTCFARKCIAEPFTPTGLGTICTSATDCESTQCAESSQDGKRCSMLCTANDDGTCPDGFECLAVANGLGACWPASGGGCCDAGGADGSAAILLGLGSAALIRRRKPR